MLGSLDAESADRLCKAMPPFDRQSLPSIEGRGADASTNREKLHLSLYRGRGVKRAVFKPEFDRARAAGEAGPLGGGSVVQIALKRVNRPYEERRVLA